MNDFLNIPLCGISALRYWLHTNSGNTPYLNYQPPLVAPTTRAARATVALLQAEGTCSPPYRFLVGDPKLRRKHACCSYQVSTLKPLSHSVRRLDNGLLLVSPELCFVLLGQHLSPIKLIQAGLDLCGVYFIDEKGLPLKRPNPLTDTARIAKLLRTFSCNYGTTRARNALKWVANGSASPAETLLYISVCLPRRLGGAGFVGGKLNREFRLTKESARALDGKKIRPDLYLPKYHLALEYDSSLHHNNIPQVARDSMRRSALESLGIRTLSVSSPELYADKGFRALDRSLHAASGKRFYPLTPKQEQARRELRRELFQNLWYGESRPAQSGAGATSAQSGAGATSAREPATGRKGVAVQC